MEIPLRRNKAATPLRLNRAGIVNQWLIPTENGYYLIDAGFPQTLPMLRRSLARCGVPPRELRGCLLTHGHIDHVGAAPWLQQQGVPIFCGEKEEAYIRGSKEYHYGPKFDRTIRFLDRQVGLAYCKPDHVLRDGECIADLKVIDSPGHTAGHIGFWQERTRSLFSGDLILGHLWRFHGPARIFTPDYPQALSSLARVLALDPETICPGHGARLSKEQFVGPAKRLLAHKQ